MSIFGTQGQQTSGGWRKRLDRLHDLCCAPVVARMALAEYVAVWRDEKCMQIVVGSPKLNRSIGRSRLKWDSSIAVYIGKTGSDRMDWVHLLHGRDQWRIVTQVDLVQTVLCDSVCIYFLLCVGPLSAFETIYLLFSFLLHVPFICWCYRTCKFPEEKNVNFIKFRKIFLIFSKKYVSWTGETDAAARFIVSVSRSVNVSENFLCKVLFFCHSVLD